MAIQLNDLITILKRESRYGTPLLLTDTPTADILASINMRGARIWGFRDWKWILEPLSIPVTPNVNAYTVVAASGNPIDRIHSIIPHDISVAPPVLGCPLHQLEIEDFYEKTQRELPLTPETPKYYCNVGMNAAGAWQILIAPTPSVAFTMTGYAKMVLYTYLQADVVANTPLKYFPNGVVLDALFAGCMIDIQLIQGMSVDQHLAAEAAWENKLKHLAGEQMSAGNDNSPVTTPAPPWWTSRNRLRSKKGTGVY